MDTELYDILVNNYRNNSIAAVRTAHQFREAVSSGDWRRIERARSEFEAAVASTRYTLDDLAEMVAEHATNA